MIGDNMKCATYDPHRINKTNTLNAIKQKLKQLIDRISRSDWQHLVIGSWEVSCKISVR